MAAAPVLPDSSTPAPAALSQGERVIDTFIAPSKTFTDIRRSASWWVPWLLISIVSLAFVYAIDKKVGAEQIIRSQIAHSSRADQFEKLPADQQARQISFSIKLFDVFAYGSPVLVLFYFLVAALVLWVTFKVGVAAETSFKAAYAIFMYASLPSLLKAIIGAVSLFAGANPEGFDINNAVGTNLGYYLDPETTGKFVRGMASSLDIINIWTIILLGIGFACTSKVKTSTAITIVAVWYLVYKLGASALGAL
jgi:Yip1-like protein